MGKATIIGWQLCPSHNEVTPSTAIYSDGSGFCFGCSTFFKQLADPVPTVKERPVENIEDRIKYIKSLPVVKHRGLDFHHDHAGYYIVWPNDVYYKRRNWDISNNKPKYSNPSGHPTPVFKIIKGANKLVVIEGEINLLSLAKCGLNVDLMSPGSAGEFKGKAMKKELPTMSNYETIVLLVDKDKAGLNAALYLKDQLQPKVPDLTVILLEKDCNQLLTEYGIEGLTNWAKEVGLS